MASTTPEHQFQREKGSKMIAKDSHCRMVLLGGMAALSLVACGAPQDDHTIAETKSSAENDSAPCDLDEAKEAVGYEKDEELSGKEQELVCAKGEILLEEERQIEEGKKNLADPAPKPEPTPDYYDEGIFGEREANEGAPSPYQFSNLWRGVIDDRNVGILVGQTKDDSTQGLVEHWSADPFTGQRDGAIFDAPIPGPLSIQKAENPRIYIVSESTGEQGVFNAQTLEWEK